MENIYKALLKYDNKWCKTLGFKNPYLDDISEKFTRKLPMFDKSAHKQNPKYCFVYDKLWVAKSQNLKCGKLEDIRETTFVNYPIFIKPRWGHESASSKNCFKINSYNELVDYTHLREMMWSEYIDGRETMTDFILVNGNIVYEMTLIYSDEQNGYTEKYKYISPDNKCPGHIKRWVNKYLTGYSGAVNVQYRKNNIIEVGLRLARGGAYFQATNNPEIINLINDVYESNTFNKKNGKLFYKPFYSFKCFTRLPILYLFPQYLIDFIMKTSQCKSFYEYYFEPNGNDGCVFFQFLHENKQTGIMILNIITYLFIFTQFSFVLLLLYIIILFIINSFKFNLRIIILVILFTSLYMTQYLNPINVHYNLYKAERQKRM